MRTLSDEEQRRYEEIVAVISQDIMTIAPHWQLVEISSITMPWAGAGARACKLCDYGVELPLLVEFRRRSGELVTNFTICNDRVACRARAKPDVLHREACRAQKIQEVIEHVIL